MLSMVRSPLKFNVEGQESKEKRTSLTGDSMDDEGLRTLVQISRCDSSSHVVVKSRLKLIKPIFLLNQTHEGSIDSCFLKSCLLCNKTLSLDKEVYMYRGDQGFCSTECRDKQIYLDEIRELESSTRKILASFRPCRDNGRWEISTFSCQATFS